MAIWPDRSADDADHELKISVLFFFFQAEDGIRDLTVTGVQTCALPIWPGKVFLKIISKMFVDLGLTTTRLHEFSSERSRIVSEAAGPHRDEFTDTATQIGKAAGWGKGEILGGAVSFKKKKKKIDLRQSQ